MQRVSVVEKRSSELAPSTATQLGRVTSIQQLDIPCLENRVFMKVEETKHMKTLFKSANCIIVIRLGETELCSNYESPKLNKQGEQQQHFYLSSNFNLKWEIDASSLISSVSLPSGLLVPCVTRRLLQVFNMEKLKIILPVRNFFSFEYSLMMPIKF